MSSTYHGLIDIPIEKGIHIKKTGATGDLCMYIHKAL
jgi:hypothetical protein